VLESVDWVNVVAITREGRCVMVEQYRFGTSRVTIETPGGMVDPGETAFDAGRRELLEETGYGGGEWTYLGAVEPNPAVHNHLCHHWLARDVELVQPPDPGLGEALSVVLATEAELGVAMRSGRLRHVLALSALSRVYPLWTLPRAPVGSGK
jgi:8-oxo-dGTP pyrophosphatase MutT (NUDIX family)